ncbi:transcription-repair coupling factor [Holzapfeliella floricola]|uniref:Transcription-repair-coupling factor n=1 Tax=Holzapfeliella floricola DSM 23037 = JCM 16512 TaxID=1423744 RepID=A0A0R2DVX1_9LACO|nr:transcription-repair coupling factor [Holzapfeliella floricola]KRN04308.1 transcriptional repair coupling factor [Holzapfeliella floricola DSM 23037 = JCM 16512]
MKIVDFINKSDPFVDFINQALTSKRSLLTGVNPNAQPIFLKAILQQVDKPILVVMESSHKADALYQSLSSIVDEDKLYYFDVDPLIATQGAISSTEELTNRIEALNFLTTQKAGIVVTTPQSLAYPLTSPQEFAAASYHLVAEHDYALNSLKNWLVKSGYKRDQMVVKPGEFALRGDILDVYPLTNSQPLRLEFFGDNLETIKIFDVETQRSLTTQNEVHLLPAKDRVFEINQVKQAGQKLDELLADSQGGFDYSEQKQARDLLLEGILPEKVSFYMNYLQEKQFKLLDYLIEDGLMVLDDLPAINDSVRENITLNEQYQTQESNEKRWLESQNPNWTFFDSFNQDKHSQLLLSLFQRGMGRLKLDQICDYKTQIPQQYFSQMPLIKTEIERYQLQEQTVVIQADNEERAKKLTQTFQDFEITVNYHANGEINSNQTQLIVGDLPHGFILTNQRFVYLTERELFNAKPKKKRQRVEKIENAQRIKNYSELKPGDYVVHVNHGIGRFEGIQTLVTNDVPKDYITITYQKGDQLFVPADQLKLVQKYVAAEGKSPKINKLGSSEWAKTKRSVAAKIEDIADELIELYAQRESEKGFAFSPDNQMQRDFESAFPYVETGDQIRSINEIKQDMEKTRPMDRLLVGDVGFGKTEVAVRAAFKAVQDNKQAAFLVPTTILAQQHYETMTERFRDFPVNIAVVSRFQTAKQVKEIIEQLKEGQIDILVGTHRLLSQDIKFKDLGLLIVDEEQRFGVKHKERLKALKAQVDVLTLTATPIPRTLHMSMVGVRDLSVIETAPTNRFPIQTYVMEQNESVIKEAILREMRRDGQVFYLHNRVEDIESVVFYLQQLVPEARVGYIHGQMSEHQLENVMMDFINGEYDVLVTTTIIETGVDLPNANTLLVENADYYGLSQLYQLRGRVGRSNRLAYAYLLYQENKVLTEVGQKRLEAIKDFTELGSGFKIAMRDLSIRGAGNMLGKQQHGFIDAVGFDLYSQMLEEAVKKRQGNKKPVKTTDSVINLDLQAYIPDDYIVDQPQKIELYKRIKMVDSSDEIPKIEDELLDRFGDYPEAVEHLLQIAELKLLADQAQVKLIRQQGLQLTVTFDAKATETLKGARAFKALSETTLKAKVALNKKQELQISLMTTKDMPVRKWIAELSSFLSAASDLLNEKETTS